MGKKIGCKNAVQQLLAANRLLHDAYDTLIEEWSPDEPPITLIFSSLGRSVSAACEDFHQEQLQPTWDCIENMLIEGDEMVKNAVATGFIEAVLSEVSAGRLKGDSFANYIGSETKAYCKAWDLFCGVKNKEID